MDKKLINIIEQHCVDAILVTNKYDITYVSKFTGEECYVLLTKTNDYLIADKRYFEQAKEQCPVFKIVLYEKFQADLMDIIKDLLKTNNIKRLGVDVCDIGHRLYEHIVDTIEDVEVADLEEP